MLNRRHFARSVLALVAPAMAHAQEASFPNRPVRLLVGFAPGGSTDVAARAIAPTLSELLGQPVVVENRPGAGGNIATEAVVRSAPDGHTILLGTIGPLIANPVMSRDLPFDPMQDLVPISLLVDAFGVLVIPAAKPWRTVSDLLAEARRRPGSLNWGYSGVGTSGHLAGLLLDTQAGIQTEGISYRGGGPLMTDLLASRLDYSFATAPTALPHVEAGRLRALAVPTVRRARLLPDVPTIAETGVPGYDVSNSYGLLAPRGAPRAAIEKIAAAVRATLAKPEVIAALGRQGFDPQPSTPDEFGAFLRAETAKWTPIIQANGLKPD